MRLPKWRLVVISATLLALVFGVYGGRVTAFLNTEASRAFLRHQQPLSLQLADPELESVYDLFDPDLQAYLRQVPIVTSRTAQTSYSIYWRNDVAFIVVSDDFFKTAAQSEYWLGVYSMPPYSMKPDQAILGEDFRFEILVHELLHIARAHLKLDPEQFFEQAEKWYRDESFGRPTQQGMLPEASVKPNMTKYLLWWYLYGQPGNPAARSDGGWKCTDYCSRYQRAECGIEEFAYIGQTILGSRDAESRMERLAEMPDSLLSSYAGIINPAILTLRES